MGTEAGAHLTGRDKPEDRLPLRVLLALDWSDVPFAGSLPGPSALLEPKLGSSAPRKRDHGPCRLARGEP